MEKKGKRIGSDNGEIPLPEATIQHIQSYLSGREAARTTVLSKSWYAAWLTRPVLNFDYDDFPEEMEPYPLFEEFAKKTMQRYQGSSLKIERFRLHVDTCFSWVHDLIVNAINIGATDLQIDFSPTYCNLPKEVLGSQTLSSLSLSYCAVDGNFTRCSTLQSLSLYNVEISDDGFKDIISCCGSIEELSVRECTGLTLSRLNLPKLHKLRHLILDCVDVDDAFFTDFASRFPCLKYLFILDCDGYTRIRIASSSLQTILFTTKRRPRAKFDVPNIRTFTCSVSDLPSQLLIKGGSTEWELDICIECDHFRKNSWFLKLKKLLTKFRLSRISLSLKIYYGRELTEFGILPEQEVDIEIVPQPLVVENLIINVPSSLCCALLVRLFGICRPKVITNMVFSWSGNASFAILRERLMQTPVTLNCGIPDQDMFGKFGLKKVNMEVYEKVDAKWLPLMLEKPLDPSLTSVKHTKIRFELIWD